MVSVDSEYMQARTVIMSLAENMIDIDWPLWQTLTSEEELKRHPETGPVSKKKFQQQIIELYNFLLSRGLKIIFPQIIDQAVCQVFTRDPCFVVKNTVYLSSMRDDYRYEEILGLSGLFEKYNVVDLRSYKNAVIEGGDVFVISPNTALVGIGQTTNQHGFDTLRDHLNRDGFKEVIPIYHNGLHLDCCFNICPDGTAFVLKSHIAQESLEIIERLFKIYQIDPYEGTKLLASNFFWLNEREVLSQVDTLLTNSELRRRGYIVHEFDFSQVSCMWGALRCVVGPLLRSPNLT